MTRRAVIVVGRSVIAMMLHTGAVVVLSLAGQTSYLALEITFPRLWWNRCFRNGRKRKIHSCRQQNKTSVPKFMKVRRVESSWFALPGMGVLTLTSHFLPFRNGAKVAKDTSGARNPGSVFHALNCRPPPVWVFSLPPLSDGRATTDARNARASCQLQQRRWRQVLRFNYIINNVNCILNGASLRKFISLRCMFAVPELLKSRSPELRKRFIFDIFRENHVCKSMHSA